MKILLRTLVILAAAMVVVGITFALNQGGVLESNAPVRPQRAEAAASSSTGTGEVREFRQRGGEGGGTGFQGFEEVGKSLLVVGVIVALYSFLQFVWVKVRGKRRNDSAPPTPQMTEMSS